VKKIGLGIVSCAFVLFLVGAADESGSGSEKAPEISPSGYLWTALQVSDVSEAAKFFKEKLNFQGEREGEYYLFRVSDNQYFVLIEKQKEDVKTDGVLISFKVKDVDGYFKQVTSKDVKAIDYLHENKELERPVWRDWGAKEFAVMGPENTILVFSRMG